MGIPRERPIEVYRVHPAVLAIAVFLSLLLQTYLPLKISMARWMDFPLLVTIYFSLLRRNKIFGIGLGTGLGLVEDALSRHYIGMFGMTKALVGYLAASSSVKFNLEHFLPRIVLTAVFVLIHDLFFLGLQHLPEPSPPFVPFEFARSMVSNVAAAFMLFLALDRFKRLV
ncbi:MAG: rod shape-determining protein MreD [Acidobacteria bacterium]|nr:MAG: rod shape-determining protein MreD [Acidobacteriota bacterium]